MSRWRDHLDRLYLGQKKNTRSFSFPILVGGGSTWRGVKIKPFSALEKCWRVMTGFSSAAWLKQKILNPWAFFRLCHSPPKRKSKKQKSFCFIQIIYQDNGLSVCRLGWIVLIVSNFDHHCGEARARASNQRKLVTNCSSGDSPYQLGGGFSLPLNIKQTFVCRSSSSSSCL